MPVKGEFSIEELNRRYAAAMKRYRRRMGLSEASPSEKVSDLFNKVKNKGGTADGTE